MPTRTTAKRAAKAAKVAKVAKTVSPKGAKANATTAGKAGAKVKAKAAPPAAATKKGAAPVDDAAEFPSIVGSEKEYLRFQGVAAAVDPRDIIPYRTDATLIYHNVSDGLDSLRAMKARIRAELPSVKFELLEELPDLALGLDYAVRQVTGDAANERLQALLKEATELRGPMLRGAQLLVEARLLVKAEVDRIVKGSGPRDRAKDCVDLSALYRKSWAAIQDKTAITPEQVARAAVVGTTLLTILKPQGARRRKTTEQLATAEKRDRLYTIVDQRHDQMRRIGVWLWGEAAVDDYVPELGSRKRVRRRNAADKAAKGKGKGKGKGGTSGKTDKTDTPA